MAIVTRVNGDAYGVVNVDIGAHDTGLGTIVSTGIGKKPVAFKIVVGQDLRNEATTGSAVEFIMRQVALNTTILMYQIENASGGQISVLVEGLGWADADLQSNIRALGNVGPNSVPLGATTVSSTGGFKLA